MSATNFWFSMCVDAARLSSEEIGNLEARLAEPEPEPELEARVRLVGAYFNNPAPLAQNLRAKHIHWLIDKHPEINICGFGLIIKDLSEDAYLEGKRLWCAQICSQPDNPKVLWNAAIYFWMFDGVLSQRCLGRLTSIQPNSPDVIAARARLQLTAAREAKDPFVRQRLFESSIREYEQAVTLESSLICKNTLLLELAQAALEAQNWILARETAIRVLGNVDQLSASQTYGDFIHQGNVVLGHVALSVGSMPDAIMFLDQAGHAPGSPVLHSFGPDFTLAAAIYKRGAKAEVASYLRACRAFWYRETALLDEWERKVVAGDDVTFDRWREDEPIP